MKTVALILMISLPQLLAAEVVDMKCYVELQGGAHVVLQQPINDRTSTNLTRIFMAKGYEVDGLLLPVVNIIECVPLVERFSLLAANNQDAEQPR